MAAAVANNLVEVEPENSSFGANRSQSNLPLSVLFFFLNGGVTPGRLIPKVAIRSAVPTPAIPTAAAAKSVTANTEESCPAPTSSTVGELAKPCRLLNAYLNCWSSLFVLQGPQQERCQPTNLDKTGRLGSFEICRLLFRRSVCDLGSVCTNATSPGRPCALCRFGRARGRDPP